MTLFNKVKALADKRKMSINELEDSVGFSRNTLYKWKNQIPNAEKLKEIADYFNVSVDYLLDRDKEYWELNEKDEKDIQTQLEEMISDLSTVGLFSKDGEEMDDNTRELLIMSLENSLRIARQESKRKFTPKKYRGGE